MSDLSDPTALTEDVQKLAQELYESSYWVSGEPPYQWWQLGADDVSPYLNQAEKLLPQLAAHFAAELDGLRAQIEEALAIFKRYDERVHTLTSAPPSFHGTDWKSLYSDAADAMNTILAQSPRGMVARIQADALTAVDARIQRQMDAEEKKEPTPSSTGHWSGLAEAQQLLRTALREGAGQ